MKKITKSEQDWKSQLAPEAYDILRGKGTEAPFSGKYVYSKENGTYQCGACGLDLFSSDTKFDSGTGWPSFYQPIKTGNVIEQTDNEGGMERTEIICGRCGSHLGHVFKDAPQTPTGLRYCMNSCALDLNPKD